MALDLRRLRYFVAVAEERHVTRAASRLGMAQPPLSQQIRALEAELGARLFDRVPSGVALTPAGAALLDDARALLDAAEAAERRARRVAKAGIGELSAGMTTSAGLHPLVPLLLRSFRERHPGISYDLHESNAAELTEAVLAGRVAVGLMRAPVARPATLRFLALAEERLLAALPRESGVPIHPGPDGLGEIRLDALSGQNFILVRRRAAPGLYANIVEACRLTGFEPRVTAEVGRMLTNLNLVAAGIGVSCVPESMRFIGLRDVVFTTIRAVPRARALLRAPLSLVFRADETRPAVLDFIATARALAATPARIPDRSAPDDHPAAARAASDTPAHPRGSARR